MIREEDEQQNRNSPYRSKEFQRKEVVQIVPASSLFFSLNDSYCCAGHRPWHCRPLGGIQKMLNHTTLCHSLFGGVLSLVSVLFCTYIELKVCFPQRWHITRHLKTIFRSPNSPASFSRPYNLPVEHTMLHFFFFF